MSALVDSEGHHDPSDGLGERLEQALKFAGINQAEFARRIDMSSGFVSDVVRGQKKPGAGFFAAARRELGISLDWLIAGSGSMAGTSRVRLDLVQTIRLHLALAKAAIADRNPQAKILLRLLETGRFKHSDFVELSAILDAGPREEFELDLILELYNGHILTSDPVEQRRNLLAAAVAHFERQNPEPGASALGLTQVNIGANQRVAGRDYLER